MTTPTRACESCHRAADATLAFVDTTFRLCMSCAPANRRHLAVPLEIHALAAAASRIPSRSGHTVQRHLQDSIAAREFLGRYIDLRRPTVEPAPPPADKVSVSGASR